MGTRSTIRFYDDGVFLCSIYQQYDGYIDNGVGDDLKCFLKSKKFVNGIADDTNVFNGPGCFVAQFIIEFKTSAGGLYITTETDEQDYNYKVEFKNYYSGKGSISLEECSNDEPGFSELIFI